MLLLTGLSGCHIYRTYERPELSGVDSLYRVPAMTEDTMYNPQIQISEKSQTKRIEIADSRKTKRPKIDKRTTHNKRHSNAIITL